MPFPQSVKDAVKKRSGGRCECRRSICPHSGRCTARAAEFNHKQSQRSGGSDTPANCEHLCESCHRRTRSYGAH